MHRTWVAGLAGLFAVLALAAPATAKTIHVTTKSDLLDGGGKCSLREAVEAVGDNVAAHGCPAGSATKRDVILLNTLGPYNLTIPSTDEGSNLNGDLDIGAGGPLTVRPAGGKRATIATAQNDRIFDLLLSFADVTFQNLRFQGGDVSGLGTIGTANVRGGQIRTSGGKLTLRNVIAQNGDAKIGGSVYASNSASKVTISDSTLTNNHADFSGGAIGSVSGNPMTITRSKVISNEAEASSPGSSMEGGGLYIGGTDLTITDSTIRDNHVHNLSSASGSTTVGGGLYASGDLTIKRTLIADNSSISTAGSSAENGGGVYYGSNGAGKVVNTTFSENTAGDNTGLGGAIFSNGNSTTTMAFDTFIGNDASGGDSVAAVAGSLQISASLITGLIFADPCDGNAIQSSGYNNYFSNDSDCHYVGTDASADLDGAGALGDNGGLSQTFALKAGGVAVNFVPKAQCGLAEGVDQRGVGRAGGEGGSACDVGAYELGRCQGTKIGKGARIGTGGRDKINGTRKADVILGEGGNDKLSGRGGNDVICGGGGKDKLSGGSGRDRLDGGVARDTCSGGPPSKGDRASRCEVKHSIP